MELIGTHNDPRLLMDLLTNTFHYDPEHITVLVDDESKPHAWPTRENMVRAMKDLVAGAQPGDHFVFHFSGHGAQVPNLDGTEKSGFDDVIWPVDVVYNEDGSFDNFIKDDEIHQLLVEHVPPGAHFMMVFDCCHSGTAADLPNSSEECPPRTPTSSTSSSFPSAPAVKNIRVRGSHDAPNTAEDRDGPQRKMLQETHTPAKPLSQIDVPSVPALADVTSWAACEDDEVTLGGPRGGVFITAFVNALKKNPFVTHAELLHTVTREIAKITAAINAHLQSADEPYKAPTPELESIEPMEEKYLEPLDI
ncbi:peptidase C14 [Wolfiporia cocos MD-104 SS10]|uniref:Peptidase C14 n=1 Tax=Wolfiporia cocos (strain MD-104) TaxID=742152 RepID=A0A2H3J908_WOLCO|nr:peptidase C14 [Wolfiporia cocos MD-104 SS10]